MDSLKKQLKEHLLEVRLACNSDNITFAYNRKLSADRAMAVADALKRDFGIASERLEPHGVGPLVPVFANSTDAGREKNRRVELVQK